MSLVKELKDSIRKALTPGNDVPEGLFELQRYARNYSAIHFSVHAEDGLLIARSTDFRFGSIVTYAKDGRELDTNIRDAIVTSFSIPSI